jgi:hypothetical protein
MVPSVPEGPLSQSINWIENRPAGHQHSDGGGVAGIEFWAAAQMGLYV